MRIHLGLKRAGVAMALAAFSTAAGAGAAIVDVTKEVYVPNTEPGKAPWVNVFPGKGLYREEIHTVWSHEGQERGYGDSPGRAASPYLAKQRALLDAVAETAALDDLSRQGERARLEVLRSPRPGLGSSAGAVDSSRARYAPRPAAKDIQSRPGPPIGGWGKTFGPPHTLRYEPGPALDPDDILNPRYLETNNGYPGQSILRLRDGSLIIPVTNARIPSDAPDEVLGRTHWPTKGTIGSLCHIGRWDPETKGYRWTAGKPVWLPRETAFNGLLEADVAELKDGRVLMVWRVTRYKDSPAYKYHGLSSDGGVTFTQPRPFRYADGGNFYSPGTFHRLFRSRTTGKLYWIGNIAPTKPKNAGHPRYPLVIGEVAEKGAEPALIRDSVTVIDTRLEGDGERLQLSNFWIFEDPETFELEVHLPRLFEDPDELFTANAYRFTLTFR